MSRIGPVAILAARMAMRAIPLMLAAALIAAFVYVPFFPVPDARVDDGLYARQATYILHFGWLGPYDQLTLAKGPFYPLFLAATSQAGLPFLVVQAALYAVVSLALARALGMLGNSRPIEFICAILLLLNPMLFEMDMLHVIREGIYVSLTMLLVALGLFWHRSQGLHAAGRVLLIGVTGTVLAAFWLTREEGVWILPTLAFIAAIHVISVHRQGYRAILGEATCLAAIGAIAAAWVGVVSVINERQYGVGDIVELKQTEFVAAYSALSRIQHPVGRRHARLGWATLEQAYRVSPAAAELQAYMQGPDIKGFVEASCYDDTVMNLPCDGEIGDALLLLGIRNATAAIGHYRTPREARGFYDRLAREVNAACDDGRISCGPLRHSVFPPLEWRDIGYVVQSGLRMMRTVVTLEGWWWWKGWIGNRLEWLPPLPPVSCLSAQPLPMCHNDAWFFGIARTSLFMTLPVMLGPDDNRDYEQARQATAQLPSTHLAMAIIGITLRVRHIFSAILPWMSGLALLCFIGAGVMQLSRSCRNYIWLGAAVCAAVVVSRIGFLALLDALMFYSGIVRFLLPVYPFVMLFCVLAPASLWRSVRLQRREAAGMIPA